MQIIDKIKNILGLKQIGKLLKADKIEDFERNRQSGQSLSKAILKRQSIRLIMVSFIGLVSVILFMYMTSLSNKRKSVTDENTGKVEEGKVKIEVSSEALDAKKMWLNHIEDKLNENDNKMNEKFELIKKSLIQEKEEGKNKDKKELEELKEKLRYAQEELKEAAEAIKLAQRVNSNNHQQESREELIEPANITSRLIDNEHNISRPNSSLNYLPESGYVKGILLGGLSVSTGVGSKGEPIPVSIRVTDRGNLPKNFEIDLKTCQILGSAYGDLSSERAMIRIEKMVCRDDVKEQYITTDVAGVIHGDDGMNGIKGKVVQTSNKQVQHAILGGLISGFANTAKMSEQFTVTGGVGISTKKAKVGEKLRDNSLAGIGNAGEKIADYYLRQAESMSPVLQVPGGVRVDIVFTKGVYLGSIGVKSKIAQARGNNDQ